MSAPTSDRAASARVTGSVRGQSGVGTEEDAFVVHRLELHLGAGVTVLDESTPAFIAAWIPASSWRERRP